MKLDEALSSFSFVRALSTEARALLSEHAEIQMIAPRTVIVRQGDEVGGAVLVASGTVRVYYLDAEGRQGTLYWVSPGEACILALNSLFSELPYPAWAESDDLPTRFVLIPSAIYQELFVSEASLRRFTFDMLSCRLLELMTLVEESATRGLESRVASLLLRKGGADGLIRTSQERLAQHLGTAREVMTRMLRRLRSQAIIETKRGSIQIVDPEALARIARPPD